MTKYRVRFNYGPWELWQDIEICKIDKNDRRRFADIAQEAVNISLESRLDIKGNYIAYNFLIFELKNDGSSAELVYAFENLKNE